MANEILTYESNAWMAVATYEDLTSVIGKLNDPTYINILKNSKDFTQSQAEEFAKRYRVDYQYSDNITGFGATLFWDTELNKHVIAIRGTEPNTFKDILNDVFLGTTGVAYEQEVALEAFYRRLTTPVSDGGLGLLGTNEVVDVTGHSLGGFLAQVFVSKHQDVVNEAYTYNAPGIDGVWGNIKAIFGTDIYPESKITNIIAGDGLTFVAGIGMNLGSIDVEFPNSGHSSVSLANMISFYSIFAEINKEMTVGEVTEFYESYHVDDVASASVEKLLTLFQISSSGNIADDIVSIKQQINNSENLNVDFLTDNTATFLANQAKSDTATLYALVNLNPFAIQGNLEAYNDLKADDYSAKYLEKRSEMLYYTVRPESANTGNGIYYQDDTLEVHTQDKLMVNYANGVSSLVEFGANGDGKNLVGFNNNDFLFGGNGNNTLYGRGGNDYLEGGEGDDRLLGNNGNDYLDAGSGEDTLDGGEGGDTLMGGDDYDTYLAGKGDTISDSDGSGRVNFEGNMLSGGTFNKNTGTYEGDGGNYSLSGGTLTFTNEAGTITIDNYSKDADSLGIHLEDDEEDDILPETSAGEGHNENFSSPLVLDLNGNGTTSTFIAQTNTYFDMDGDGFKERTSWTESSDGLLTLDLNNDGIVTNGTELFGNNTKLTNGTLAKDGFEALSQYDLNKDNVIDAKDSIYAHLKVWIDSNSDGISTNDELKTLQELNITSINLNAKETSTSEAYNQISDTSSFTQDGQTKTINDVWFYQNKSDTTYDYTTPIKESVALLPTIEGSGRVKDLQDAMNDDSVLEAKVTNLLKSASTMSFANFSSAFNFFTCKTFTIQKALHVKIQNRLKGAKSDSKYKVA